MVLTKVAALFFGTAGNVSARLFSLRGYINGSLDDVGFGGIHHWA